MKKLTSVLLSVVMLMSVLCMPTQAVEAEDCLKASASVDEVTGLVTVKVIAQQAATNGKFTVEYDSECLTYTGINVNGVVVNVEEEGNTVTVAYANTTDEAVAKGGTVAVILFSTEKAWTTTRIEIAVAQFNAHENLNLDLPTIILRGMGEADPDPAPTPGPSTPVDPTPGPSTPVDPTPGPSTPVDPTPTPGGDKEEPEVTVDPDGTVTETTKNEDGSTTTTVETPDGTTSTTVTDENGNVIEAAAEISKDVKDGETVTIPVEVPAASSSEEAVSVEITVPSVVESVVVEIPVTDVTPGSVVVLVHEDGTEEIVPSTALTENGLAITVDGSVTIKVVDNTKEFTDDDMWAKDAITFVTSREIFNGTGDGTFNPDGEMTRAMLMTVLARLDGQDTSSGAVWYEQGMEWAKENGISDGTNPDGNITREQLATMLYRYAGEPGTNGELDSFTDGGEVSDYAEAAMQWAVENGLINGMGDGSLNPKGEATRAQLAKILMFFINL